MADPTTVQVVISPLDLVAGDNIILEKDGASLKISSAVSTIFDTAGPDKTVSIDIAAQDSKMFPVSEIKMQQDGTGTPAITNIRNIRGYDSITLTYNQQEISQKMPQTVYRGTYDWASGTLSMTHKMFELYPRNMNRSEEYPGWNNTPELEECIKQGASYILLSSSGLDYAVNIMDRARMEVKQDGSNVIYVGTSQSDGGMTQSQWITKYPNQVCQFLLPLLEPKTIRLTPREFISITEENTFTSNCGDTKVTFYANIKKYIDKRMKELLGQE